MTNVEQTTDLAAELAALRHANELRDARSTRTRKTIIVVCLLAILALLGLWETGRMDPFLSQFGLNKNDCVKNGFGATFCGSDATRYQQNVAALGQDLSGGNGVSSSAESAQTMENQIRAAIPAAEAFFADNGTYAGMTGTKLRQIDSSIPAVISVGTATASNYCLQAESGDVTVSWTRPGDNITYSPCP